MNTEPLTSEAIADAASPATERAVRPVLPAADLIDGDESVLLLVEMPGVNQSGVEVAIENGVLEITGTAQRTMPQGYEPVAGQPVARRYERRFRLSDAIDSTQLTATLADGLLSISLPKHARNRRVRFEVRAAS